MRAAAALDEATVCFAANVDHAAAEAISAMAQFAVEFPPDRDVYGLPQVEFCQRVVMEREVDGRPQACVPPESHVLLFVFTRVSFCRYAWAVPGADGSAEIAQLGDWLMMRLGEKATLMVGPRDLRPMWPDIESSWFAPWADIRVRPTS